MVADAISRKSSSSVSIMTVIPKSLLLELQNMEMKIVPVGGVERLFAMSIKPTLLEKIIQSQRFNPYLISVKEEVELKKVTNFEVSSKGVITFQERLCVPNVDNLREEIHIEAHNTLYSVHPGRTKMYKDLKMHYWWPGMKNDIVQHIE